MLILIRQTEIQPGGGTDTADRGTVVQPGGGTDTTDKDTVVQRGGGTDPTDNCGSLQSSPAVSITRLMCGTPRELPAAKSAVVQPGGGTGTGTTDRGTVVQPGGGCGIGGSEGVDWAWLFDCFEGQRADVSGAGSEGTVCATVALDSACTVGIIGCDAFF